MLHFVERAIVSLILTLPLSLLAVPQAEAQVPSAERKCIERINDGARKVANVFGREARKCVKGISNGKQTPATLNACVAPGVSLPVARLGDRFDRAVDRVCGGAPPTVGPPSLDTFEDAAVQRGLEMTADLFGPDLSAVISADKDTNNCQSDVLNAVRLCADKRLKEFRKCKSDGLKVSINDTAGLQDQCIGTSGDQPDPKGKIARACDARVGVKIGARCVNKGVDLQTAFPGCNEADAADLQACIDASVRCRVCNLLNTVDGLSRSCDEFDDGDDLNDSCPIATLCGDSAVEGGEACDDGNLDAADGCDFLCAIEAGFQCSGSPSSCSGICGDSLVVLGEGCDDGGTATGDGCSDVCQVEAGFTCSGAPSVCSNICGDGLIVAGEGCDDGDASGGDGCSATCQVESGFICAGQPSTCNSVCGDGEVVGSETCDDGGTAPGDGCSAVCQVESGYDCSGAPSTCSEICGDSLVVGAETCDDGGTSPGDGCSAVCGTEPGYNCTGEPSVCSEVCGDGLIVGSEICDDGNTDGGDGCNATCSMVEPGWICSGEPSNCQEFQVIISNPTHGSFTEAASVNVTGDVTVLPPAQATLTINGTPVTVQPNGSFSTTVALDAAAIFNPIRAIVTDTVSGFSAHDRVVQIVGPSVADGDFSDDSVALRLRDTGLDQVEPLVADLAGAGLDLADLVPVGTVLINNQCFIDSIFGCLGRATVRVANPPPSFSSFSLEIDSQTNFVEGDITVNDIRVDVRLDGSGLVPSCDIGIDASAAFFDGDYGLDPAPDGTLDVNQIGNLAVSFTNFNTSFGGICDAPIIGDIIQAFLPDVEALTIDAMADFLSDPDGAGPLDSPTADAIEEALLGISIAGPIGSGLGVTLDAPISSASEDTDGITLGTDSRFTVQVGTDPGQCIPPPGAPDLTASLAANAAFPTFSPTTPVGGLPYHLGLCISTEGFNQLLRSQIECGLLVTSITEIDLGSGPLPLNSTLLSAIIPEYATLPLLTPLRIDIRPTLAPVVTGDPGPGGELTELRISHVIAEIVRVDTGEITLVGAFDANVGLDLQFSGGGLGIVLTPPGAGGVAVAVVDNPLGVDEANLETSVLPPLVALLLPDLAGSLAGFPLPAFFGLDLQGVEVSKNGDFLSLFADLVASP